jgi:metallo-beta-lactamase class B
MSKFLKKISSVLFLLIPYCTFAQKVQEPNSSTSHPEWSKPYLPFRIVGNLYYVGTYDLACYLIITPKGNILINTGLADSEKQIKNNIKTLGFRFADTKILLNTQAHYDHMGAMAAIKKKTKAKLFLDEKDAETAMDGGKSDYALGGEMSSFAPVNPDKLLKNNDAINLGNMQLVIMHHPGHTKGSSSYLFTVKDAKKSYKVLIANMPTIVTDSSFDSIPAYPEIAADYAYTLNAMKNITFDIWLASHASQFDLHTKHKPGDAYCPSTFVDKVGYETALKDLQKDFDEKINKK